MWTIVTLIVQKILFTHSVRLFRERKLKQKLKIDLGFVDVICASVFSSIISFNDLIFFFGCITHVFRLNLDNGLLGSFL